MPVLRFQTILYGCYLRAKDGIRTRDPDLGKVVLYQLSYFRLISTIYLSLIWLTYAFEHDV